MTRLPLQPFSGDQFEKIAIDFENGPLILIHALQARAGDICHGRLAASLEGGGKRRLLIIGNSVKQRLLKPYHDWAMQVLRRLVCEGTYDQMKPLSLLRGKHAYSYDLKSATDRFPRAVTFQVLSMLFDPYTASSVVNTCLGLSPFLVGPPFVNKDVTMSFIVGQPLGYYSPSASLFHSQHS